MNYLDQFPAFWSVFKFRFALENFSIFVMDRSCK